MTSQIKFVGQILDNVHGFIPYTAAEKKIMETQLFKRLQSIKQLSVVNWVYPGSEHTRATPHKRHNPRYTIGSE